jgi:uncharacterized protein (DUF1015 family)
MTAPTRTGLSLAPFRAFRPTAGPDRLGRLLCPPYDVIGAAERAQLVAGDPDNAVTVILPETTDGTDPYQSARARLDDWATDGTYAADGEAALYVYEMAPADGPATRGLLGAVELRDPADGVILPHENTMAGPVADRLALMTATEANLEPIYLVYDGGGHASAVVAGVDTAAPIATATTPDGVRHRLWAVTDPAVLEAVEVDLADRRALIADGHHRYATYRELQSRQRATHGAGPWDRGLTLLVDSASHGPQVHAIHRVIPGLDLQAAVDAAGDAAENTPASDLDQALAELDATPADRFAAVLTDGARAVVLRDRERRLAGAAARADEPAAVAGLDVTILHRGLVESVWGLPDTVERVHYAHSVEEAVAAARDTAGVAVLLRPTPVAAVAAVAAAGGRMPRKSTLFTPKPASGLVMRRFADQR